jgi:catechol 2,3-dioxygenase-like lactoylglutathione lyase family enzyme
MFISNVEASKAWYSNVFNAAVVFEDEVSVAFAFDNTTINLLKVSDAPELVTPRSVSTPGPTSHSQLSIWTDNLDDVVSGLAEVGIPLLNGPIDRPWGMRTATIADPDGHVWEIAQAMG